MLGQLHKFIAYMPYKVGDNAFSLALNDYVTIDRVIITIEGDGNPLIEYLFSTKEGRKHMGLENNLIDVEKAPYYLRNPLRPFTEF